MAANSAATVNEGIVSMAKKYPNKNAELRRVALFAFECARNTIREGANGATIGADEHFAPRQEKYVDAFESLLDNLANRPVPDAFGLPDTQYPIDLSELLNMITTDVGGSSIPLNEDLELVTTGWFQLAVQLASSDSAGWRGGMNDHDAKRSKNAAAVIRDRIQEIADGPDPDFTATSDPGATR